MADSHAQGSSDKIVNNLSDCLDFNKLKEYITSKRVAYDGTRVKWCDNYDSLTEFIESIFCQHGKWWSSGDHACQMSVSWVAALPASA